MISTVIDNECCFDLRRIVALCAVGLLGGLWLFGCSPSPKPEHLVLVTFDTTRADRFGFAGYDLARTDTADRLAREGVVCTDAVAPAPLTMPSHATIMTGLLPPSHGVRDNGAYVLSDDAVTLAEVLTNAGYESRAFVSAVVLSRRYGLDQGFAAYDDDLYAEDDPRLFMIRDRPADRTVDRALEWYRGRLEEERREPFFVWLHFFDPHQPYRPPMDLAAVCPTPYDAEIAAADRALGRFLDALEAGGDLGRTLVVLTADHGESLGEHGEKTHGVFVYDATVRVPLVFRAPGALPGGTVTDAPFHGADVAPTVLSLLGIPTPAAMSGADLSAVLQGRATDPDRPQYVESLLAEVGFGMAPLHGVRWQGYKWIRAPRPELYDLRDDPGETDNLLKRDPARAERMDAELQRIMDQAEQGALSVVSADLTTETTEMLAALGYLAPAEDREGVSGMDPKDGLAVYNDLEQARHLAQEERWSEAEQRARTILAELPGHISARNVLALTLLRQGRAEEAMAEYERSLASDPHQSRVWAMLANIKTVNGDLDGAVLHVEKALELSPSFVEAMATRGLIEVLRGEFEAAQQWYDRAIAVDPNHPRVHRRVGDLLYELERWPESLEAYREALKRHPDDFRGLVQAGNAARRTGDVQLAEDYLRSAANLRPDSWVPAYNLACLAGIAGAENEALEWLHVAVNRGFSRPRLLLVDEDLECLRDRPEFDELLRTLSGG
jgi:choline-sulfatase